MDSFSNPEVQQCPFPLIKKLHESHPIYLDPGTGFYVVSRYDDIVYISAHPELFSNKTSIIIGGDDVPGADQVRALYEKEGGFQRFHTLVTNDPPGHTQYRKVVDKVFAPSFVKSLEPYITSMADKLIDDFIENGETNLLDAFCIRLPIYIIADQLGFPRSDWQRIKKWSDNNVALINPGLRVDERLALCKVSIELQKYLAAVRERYLKHEEQSFYSRLAVAEVDGRRLDAAQFVNVAEQLLVAGNETTTNGIAHAVVMAIQQPALLARLVADPSLIGNYTEEVLRVHAPSPHLYRQVLQNVEMGPVRITKGSILMISYLEGNHDPTHYHDPARIDLDRAGIRNHLSFGRGIHYCVGNQLARAEMRIGATRLFQRLKNLRFTPRSSASVDCAALSCPCSQESRCKFRCSRLAELKVWTLSTLSDGIYSRAVPRLWSDGSPR